MDVEKGRIMGMGHRVYEGVIDPRAPIMARQTSALIAAMRSQGVPFDEGVETMIATADRLQEVGAAHPKLQRHAPNVDFRSFIGYRAMGLPTEMMTPQFFAGRVSGEVAHIYEQLHARPKEQEHQPVQVYQTAIWRGRQSYNGERPCPLPSEYAVRGQDCPFFLHAQQVGFAANGAEPCAFALSGDVRSPTPPTVASSPVSSARQSEPAAGYVQPVPPTEQGLQAGQDRGTVFRAQPQRVAKL